MRKLKNFAHLLLAILANSYYGFPSRKLKVIGVTGTDGKTTTTYLIYHILKSAGKKVSMISTVYAVIGNKVYDTGFHTTTPRSKFELQGYLKNAVDAGDEYFILETTSHAIDQSRVYGVSFLCSVITNITHEHLDYHKTHDNYLRTKAKLLLTSQKAVVNRDDQSYEKLKTILQKNHKSFYTYGLKSKADFTFNAKKSLVSTIHDFNNYNYLAAYSVTSVLGINEKDILSALKTFKLPLGRLEVVYDKDFSVIVDFAHTPNALEKLLTSVKSQTKKRIIHVFGAAGLRDHLKRPLMGKTSGKYADVSIITEEDYRTEDPAEIAVEVAQGVESEGKNPITILDRESAIKHALTLAKPGDIVLITGKGHEKSLCRGTVEYPWSDQETVKKLIKERS